MKNENPYIISHFQVRWNKYLSWHNWKTNVDLFFQVTFQQMNIAP